MRVIQSVEVHSLDPDGVLYYEVGKKFRNEVTADIIEIDGNIQIYNQKDEIMTEVRNCPVIIQYADAPKESEGSQ